VTSI
jgi:hypothetical protein